MPNVVQVKYKLRNAIRDKGLRYNKMNLRSKWWGPAARTNTWRLTKKLTGRGKTSLKAAKAVLYPPKKAAKPRIIQHGWLWNGSLGKRYGDPPHIVIHNSGSTGGTIEGIHAYHKSLGWLGVAYHFVVYKNGDIHEGRPTWAMGGHAYMAGTSIGVCFIGNYESSDKVMPKAQLEAGKALCAWLHEQYPKATFKRHRDMPHNSTACPGKYMPFNELTR